MFKTLQKDISRHRGSTFVLSMFIHYPNDTHRIQSVSPGGVGLQGAHIRGGLYSRFYSILCKHWVDLLYF